MAAEHLPDGARARARGRSRRDRDDQADRPYFVLQGNICALQATKDHVNVFLYDPLVPDPEGIITSGHENTTGRTVAIYQGETINESALLAMFKAIIAHNRAGGWRTVTRGEQSRSRER